ncbi:hypothetical protein BD289DRAFT_103038 [Coniella lustricola]|uniref:Uncharacterized protein n=1 Tax=Coniella lustricola TaxID=2025994 RepID=A0A2T2ZXZ2_9PEZI|nr:hypothetical protein BD289DRAFT_103038 [Coniella lustricola]
MYAAASFFFSAHSFSATSPRPRPTTICEPPFHTPPSFFPSLIFFLPFSVRCPILPSTRPILHRPPRGSATPCATATPTANRCCCCCCSALRSRLDRGLRSQPRWLPASRLLLVQPSSTTHCLAKPIPSALLHPLQLQQPPPLPLPLILPQPRPPPVATVLQQIQSSLLLQPPHPHPRPSPQHPALPRSQTRNSIPLSALALPPSRPCRCRRLPNLSPRIVFVINSPVLTALAICLWPPRRPRCHHTRLSNPSLSSSTRLCALDLPLS